MIPLINDLPSKADAALYFLDGGHYLFRSFDESAWRSKFVTARDVAAAFSQREEDTGWLPAGVVRCGYNPRGAWFVYSAPAQKVEIRIAGETSLITIPIPRTMLIGLGSSYFLLALHAKHFKPDLPVFKAPFPNIHTGGRICWGTNTPPLADAGKARDVWDLFFSTPFNQDLADDKSKTHPKNVLLQLRALAEGKVNSYPADDLVSIRGNVSQRIENILKGGN